MRGITIRQGNILIGEENFLSEYFTEKRFVTWCIGEIYVSKNIKVNARRDGFEHTEEYETLVEQFGLLGSYLSNICRQASNIRSKKQNEQVLRNQMESIKDHSIAVNKEHKENLERFVYKAGYEKPTEVIDKIVLLEDLLEKNDLKHLNTKAVIKAIASIMLAESSNPINTASILSKITRELIPVENVNN